MRRDNPQATVSSETDMRTVAAVLLAPQLAFYDPSALHFPEAMRPVVPGGVNDVGLTQVEYDHQPKWKRFGFAAGPVRAFFRAIYYNNRTRQV